MSTYKNIPKLKYIRATDEAVKHEKFFANLDHAIVSNIDFIEGSVIYFLNENEDIHSIDSINSYNNLFTKTKNIVISIQKIYTLAVTYENFYNKIKGNKPNSHVNDLFLKNLFSQIKLLLKDINEFWKRLKGFKNIIVEVNELESQISNLKYEKQNFEKNHIGKKAAFRKFRSLTDHLHEARMFEVTADLPPWNIVEPIFKLVFIPMVYGFTSLKCIPSTIIGIGQTCFNVVNRNIINSKIENCKSQINRRKADNLNIETDNLNIEPEIEQNIETDNLNIEPEIEQNIKTCISDIISDIKTEIEKDIEEMYEDISEINFIDPTLQDFKDRYNSFMNYIQHIYKIETAEQYKSDEGFSITYFLQFETYINSISTTKSPRIIETSIHNSVNGGAKKTRRRLNRSYNLLRKTKHNIKTKHKRIYRKRKTMRQTKKR